MEVVLEAAGLSKTYDSDIVVGPIDFQVRSGQIVALIGENGAGKTTLLGLCAGLLEPSAGFARVLGTPAGSAEARSATAFIPDTPILYDDISIYEQAEYLAAIYEVPDWTKKTQILMERFKISNRAHDLPARLSAGLRKKGMLLLSFLRPFRVMLADEPFESLDPEGVAALVALLRESAQSGAAVMVATHRLEYTKECDRSITLNMGKVVMDQT